VIRSSGADPKLAAELIALNVEVMLAAATPAAKAAQSATRPRRRWKNCGRATTAASSSTRVVPDYYARYPKPCVGGAGGMAEFQRTATRAVLGNAL
jgi:hypothetical protein